MRDDELRSHKKITEIIHHLKKVIKVKILEAEPSFYALNVNGW